MAKLILIYNLFQVTINVARRKSIAQNPPVSSKTGAQGARERLETGLRAIPHRTANAFIPD